MPAQELRIADRTAYFRKSITTPDFASESVLSRDPFQFAELWLKRNCVKALPFWLQSKNYFAASKGLPPESPPLTSYYCFLNATKALLTVKGVPFSDRHGVSGEFDPGSKRVLSNETVTIQSSGVLTALIKYLGEEETAVEHSLMDLLANLPFIHRAYRHTFRSEREVFIPLRNVVYRKHPTASYVWFSAEISGRFADARTLRTLPHSFEVDVGYPYTDRRVVRTKKRARWFARGASAADKQMAIKRLHNLHHRLRKDVALISAPIDLWYIKRDPTHAKRIDRFSMTIMMAAMHRLSEMSRYDPKGLSAYLAGRANWLLSEFIQLSPSQFIDELVCEMTSLEFRIPGVRP